MIRRTVAVTAMLIVLLVLVGTNSAGFTAAPNLQQLDVEIWLSQTEGGNPVRRLDPGTSEAQLVIHSNLDTNDPQDFRAVLLDAGGIQVFRSGTLSLGTGEQTNNVAITGKDVFQGYVTEVEAQKDELGSAIDRAITAMEQERGKAPCAQEPTQRTQTSRVIDRVNQALGVREAVDGPVAQLLNFDSLAEGAQTDFTDARTALAAVAADGAAATEKLEVPDDAPTCDDIDAPDWEPDWDAVRADLDAMNSDTGTAVSEIDSALAVVDREMDRSFPSIAIEGQCNQNTIQLQVAGSDVPTDDFWFAVGTPGDPARLTNPEEPTGSGNLLSRPTRIYATTVNVAGVVHSSQIEALVLDDACLPVAGASVNFTTPSGSPVEVAGSPATTDANGLASVTANATAETGNGTATVDAQVDSAGASVGLIVIGPPAEGEVQLRLRGAQTDKADPYFGVQDSTQITAVVRDEHGNNVADGTPVQFTITPPDDHTFSDGGSVTTDSGEASSTLVFGPEKRDYVIQVESGGITDSQQIFVVGPPNSVEVQASPRTLAVNTPNVDDRSSVFTVNVVDAQDNPAPDSTILEYEFLSEEDAGLAYFQNLNPVSSTRYRQANLVGGETRATLVANQGLTEVRDLEIRVTAIYMVGDTELGSASADITVRLLPNQLEEAVFLPLISK